MRLPNARLPQVWLAAAALAALLVTDLSPAAAQDGAGGDGSPPRRGAAMDGNGRPGRARRFMRFRAMQRARNAQRRHAVAEAMALTPDQQRLVVEKSRAAQPIVAEARREAAKLLVQRPLVKSESGDGAQKSPEDRAARRAAMKDVRTRASEKLSALAKDVVASLTPEQRAKLEGLAAAHGRKLDETKLTRRIGRWLARPMTADLMEAKLGTR